VIALLLLLAAVALGAFAQGATGIGFGLLVAPVSALVLDPGEVVGTVARIGLVIDLVLVVRGRAIIDRRVLANYVACAVLAVPFGIAAVAVLPDTAVIVGVSLLTLAGAATLLVARPVPDRAVVAGRPAAQRVAGFAAGFMGVTSGMPGPPVAIEAARRHAPPAQARATLAALFVVVDSAAVAANPHAVPIATTALLAVVAAVGLLLAKRLAGGLDPAVVRRGLLALVVASALGALVRVLL
jgi:uncharacterized protein